MPVASYYTEAAQRLAREVGKGFKSLGLGALRNALREASGANLSIADAARNDLEAALLREHIHVHPSLKDTNHDTYRLYHRDNLVAKLVDAVTDPSETTDRMLEDILAQEEVTEVITVRTRQVRNAP